MLNTGLFKKAVSILLSALLFVSVFCTTVQAMQPQTGTLQSAPLSLYTSTAKSGRAIDYDNDIDMAKLRAMLRDTVLNYAYVVNLGSSYNLPATQQTIELISTIIVCEIPEAFHYEAVEAIYDKSTNMIFQLRFTYNCSPEEYVQKRYEYEREADTLLYGIIDNNNLTDVQKALLLHDRLALHCEYGDVNGSYLDTATLYGALVGKAPVCQGYAAAYIYLLGRVGIRSEMCISKQLNHAWNIVYIDDEAYHVDVTWDDPTPDVAGQVYHYNFLLSTQALKNGISDDYDTSHNANDFNTTPVSTKYDNAYWQHSFTAFQLLDNEIYYIDNDAQKLCRESDKAQLADVSDTWYISADGYYMVGNYACLAADTQYLYYSLSDSIYRFDPKTESNQQLYTPAMTHRGETFYSMAGFAYQYGIMQIDLINEDYIYRTTINHCDHTDYFDKTITKGDCITEGCTRHICKSCLAYYESFDLNPQRHTGYIDFSERINPTCGTPGKKRDTLCRDCGEVLEEGEVIPATGNHTWGEAVPENSDICTGILVYTYTCTVCGDTKQETHETENTVHAGETELRNAKEETCGYSGYTGDLCCTACNHVITPGQVIPATGNHAWDEGFVAIPPSMFAEGTRRYTCTTCGRTKDEDIPRLANALKGDIDMDGSITAGDARLALRASVGLEELTGNAFIAANVDNNHTITANDARLILRYSVGLETEWPS